ncbi:HAD family hydrolase [Salinarimonas sp.]|uniref:HAD family hydrolase n=1 Tax=Salinarimonas sp. TaxID=2766526 RepID=UPI0032D99C1C
MSALAAAGRQPLSGAPDLEPGSEPRSVGEIARAAAMAFFDCDGVLLDANRVKLDAVADVLADAPAEKREACLATFAANFGRGRAEHFATFHRILGGAPEDAEDFVRTRTAAYAALLAERYPLSAPAPGARALVGMLRAAHRPCAVVTGGVGAEAARALDAAGFAGAFDAVIGTPTPKAEAMAALLAERGLRPDEAVLFGDAVADRDAARALGVPFVFVSGLALVSAETVLSPWPANGPPAYAARSLDPIARLAPART